MYFITIILSLVIYLFLFNFIKISSTLNYCKDNRSLVYNNNNNELDECYKLQLSLAKQRHIIKLVKYNQFTNIQLTCHLCSNENRTHFQWFRITRKKYNQTIFLLNNITFYDHKWILDQNLYEPIISNITTNDPCIMNNTNELIYEKFDPYNDSGTYICQSLYNNKHPTNFIWYHIDYINPYQNKLSQFNISSINKIVTTYQQLIKLQNNIKKQIYLLNSFYNQKFNLLYITIKFYHNLTQYTYCNNIYNIQINYICYIRIPRKLLYNNIDEIQLIYFILFNGFYQFGQFYDDDNNKINQSNLTKIYKTFFENLANQLNFKLFLNKTYLYIPCQYNLFKQLPNLNYTFQPLNILNYYIIIKYKFNCKQLNNKKNN
uniref:Ig-like domain-containing protein n=1 Tax=Schistosoma mansoni TaxID=6183 RepID=A0A5K4F5Q2_SCHMA